ncbi:MAG: alpha/beta hydrolase, partial [Alphaproteobacteria bacterium]|nr:alpha/beta hydrolase [Alphaproteobacteria bacterium]
QVVHKGYVDTGDGQVHYLEAGKGYPLVLLHMTSDAATQYETGLPQLAARGYRAVALDLPGHGNSYVPRQQPDSAAFARSVAESMTALGITKATLLGIHFGATIAAWTHVHFPAQVERLCFYGWPRHDDALRAQRRAAVARVFDEAGEAALKNWTRRWEIGRLELPDGQPNRCTQAQALRAMAARMQVGPNWYWAYHCIGNTDPVALAGRVRCPVLLFAGPRDQNWQRSQDALADFSDARFVAMDWVGEYAPEEDPPAFARVVDEFVRSTAAGAPAST